MKHYSAKRKAAVLSEDATEALYHWRKQAMAGGEMSAVSKKKAERFGRPSPS